MANAAQPTTGSVKLPKSLSTEVVKTLTSRIADEYTAHYFYQNAANWCNNVGYLKAAAFFTAEASAELEHSNILQKYLTDWNVQPELPSVPTKATFTSLVDVIEQAYDLEYNLLNKYTEDSRLLFGIDLITFDFLGQFRAIQMDSVVEYSDLLNALALIDIDSRLDLLHFEEMYMGE